MKLKSIHILLIALVCFTIGNSSFAQNAYLYQDSVYYQSVGYTEKIETLNNDKDKYEQELKGLQKNLKEKILNLTSTYNSVSGETMEQVKMRMSAKDAEMLSLLEEENKLLDKRIASYNKVLEDQYNNDIMPYVQLVNSTIESYALKNKIDFVWIMENMNNSLAYANKGKNITSVIIKMVNAELEKSVSKTPPKKTN